MSGTSVAPPATVNLTKGQKVDLTKTNPGLVKILFGLGWDLQDGVTFDLDAFAIPLKADGKQHSAPLYFGSNKKDGNWVDQARPFPFELGGSLAHSGDNLTGAGEGDDEVITVDTATLPAEVDKVAICVNIYNAGAGQNFGQVKGAFCRAFDGANPAHDIIKYDLNEDFSTATCVVIGELYRKDGEWKFQAIGLGKTGDINAICAAYQN